MWDPPLPPPSQRPARILKPNKPPLRRRLYDLMKKHRPTCPRHTHTHALVLPSPVRDCFARSHAWLRSGPGLLGFCLGGSPVSAEDQRHQGPAWGERIRAPFQRVPFPMGKKKIQPLSVGAWNLRRCGGWGTWFEASAEGTEIAPGERFRGCRSLGGTCLSLRQKEDRTRVGRLVYRPEGRRFAFTERAMAFNLP